MRFRIFLSHGVLKAQKNLLFMFLSFSPLGLGQPRDDALVYFFFSFGGCCGLFLVWEWLNDDRVASVMLHGLLIVFSVVRLTLAVNVLLFNQMAKDGMVGTGMKELIASEQSKIA